MIQAIKEKYLDTKKIWVIYILWALFSFTLFMILRFPSEIIVRNLTSQIERQVPGLSLQAGKLGYSFPAGIKTKNISAEYQNMLLGKDMSVILSPAIIKAVTGNKQFDYTVHLYENQVTGKVDIKSSLNNPSGTATVIAEEMDISKISSLREILKRDVSGILNINSRIDFKDSMVTGLDSVSVLTDSEIALNNPLLPVKSVKFSRIDMNAGYSARDRKVRINQCTFSGPIVNGSISGDIIPGQPFDNSRLNITGTLKVSHAFLAEMGDQNSALKMMNKESLLKGIGFTLRGTVKRPDFRIKQKK